MKKKIIIPYFHSGFKYAFPFIFLLGGLLIYWKLYIFGSIFLTFSVLSIGMYYVTEIDLRNKRYSDYFFFLGLKLYHKSEKFTGIDRVYLIKEDQAQTVSTRAQYRKLNWTEFTAILLFTNGKTLELLTKNDKRELMLQLLDMIKFLKTEVEDRTTPQHFWIDLNKVK